MSEEKRLWYHWCVLEATEEEMDALTDRIAEAVGCNDGPDHVCPHFRVGGYRLPRDEDTQDDELGKYVEKLERRIEALLGARPVDGISLTSTATAAVRDGEATG